jgi:hypothetical protein
MHDPLISSVAIGIRRVLLFLCLAFSIGTALWLVTLTRGYHAALRDLLPLTQVVWDGRSDFTATALFYGCYLVGVLCMAFAFALAAHWWRGRGDTLHHRGPNIIDRR